MKEFEESNQKNEFSIKEGSSLPSGLETKSADLPGGPPSTSFHELSKPHFFIQKGLFTCTFFMDQEASSIHFDCFRGEIFFNGHNIRNMILAENQIQALHAVGLRLLDRRQNVDLLEAYQSCLTKALNP